VAFSKLATILGLLVSTSTTPGEGVKPGGLPEPVVTRQTFFAIPFQVNAGSQPGTEARRGANYTSPQTRVAVGNSTTGWLRSEASSCSVRSRWGILVRHPDDGSQRSNTMRTERLGRACGSWWTRRRLI
jgi:hypothetical protein